jgi:exodeoxyribonuclease VII large subunit
MTSTTRIDLAVPYSRKEEAKALGARWDAGQRTWFAPPGTDLRDFDRRWLPEGFQFDLEPSPEPISPDPDAEPEKGISLSELLSRVRSVIDQAMPEPVWVRAEITELRGKNGHLYLSLTERDERGGPLANSKGVIFRNRATTIVAKFEDATGEGLKPDIKILCLAKVRFDPLYGLDLIIEDVDPSYTLGDLAAKLARIRQRLVLDDIYERNKGIPTPSEFVRVAVISPETSAGLGDFRRETDRLQDAGLCEFLFFGAMFQGLDAPSSIRTAVNGALAANRQRTFDALVIIRGGGSVTDLAWLNDLELSRLLCLSPIPVFTGIGHERDNTILDEIAHSRFDTPSKVALHISTTIKENALATVTAFEQITFQVARILTREQTSLATQIERIEAGVRSVLDQAEGEREKFIAVIQTVTHYRIREERTLIRSQVERLKACVQSVIQQAEDDHENFTAAIRTTAQYQIREASQALAVGYVRLIGTTDQTLCDAHLNLDQSMEGIAHRTQLRLREQMSAIERTSEAIVLQAEARIEAEGRDLDHQQAIMVRETVRWITKARDELDCGLTALSKRTTDLFEAAHREIEGHTRMIVGMGPQATLRRGFSMVRDVENRPVTSRDAAMRNPEFTVQFHDGSLTVTNQDYVEGDGR